MINESDIATAIWHKGLAHTVRVGLEMVTAMRATGQPVPISLQLFLMRHAREDMARIGGCK